MTHDERVWHHEMETCEGIHEHAERIAKLEELVLDMWGLIEAVNACGVNEHGEPMGCATCTGWGHTKGRHIGCRLTYRMAELGIEVA